MRAITLGQPSGLKSRLSLPLFIALTTNDFCSLPAPYGIRSILRRQLACTLTNRLQDVFFTKQGIHARNYLAHRKWLDDLVRDSQLPADGDTVMADGSSGEVKCPCQRVALASNTASQVVVTAKGTLKVFSDKLSIWALLIRLLVRTKLKLVGQRRSHAEGSQYKIRKCSAPSC